MSKKLNKTHGEAWRLFITAHAKLINLIDNRLSAAEKIPLHWYDVLIELNEAPDKRLRMYDLAERVVLSRSGLTRLVDKLEKEALLKREVDPADRRGFYVIITDSGTEALRQAWPVYAEGIADFFAVHLTEVQTQSLISIFSTMIAKAPNQ